MFAILLVGLLVLVLVYTYALYPPLVRSFAKSIGQAWTVDSNLEPTVSVILAVHNEESVLAACIEGLLRLEYPVEKLEILIGSDGSSDHTSEILRNYAARHPLIRAFHYSNRRGKIPVVNDLVQAASGSILLFTDADVTFDRTVIRSHVKHYVEDSIGAVSGALVIVPSLQDREGHFVSEHSYMEFETELRMNEARIASTVGIFGGNYSTRRANWQPIPDAPIADELHVACRLIEAGQRVVFEPFAIARETFDRSTTREEFKRRVRYAARGLETIKRFPRILWLKAGWPSLMLWSHKLLRWVTPPAVLLIAGLTVFGIASHSHLALWFGLAGIETLFLVAAMLGGLLLGMQKRVRLFEGAWWFLSMNVAFTVGIYKFLFSKEQRFWTQPPRAMVENSLRPQEVTAR